MLKADISAIVDEIEPAIATPPVHGTVTLTLVFRESNLDRWVLAREESKRTITGGDITTSSKK